MAIGSMRAEFGAHAVNAAPVVNYPKAQPAEGNTSIHTARVCGQLDSKQYSSSAEVTPPFLETGSPSTPCGLHAARRTIALRVACPNVVCYEASDMAHYLLRKLHHVRSFEDTAHKKYFNFHSTCPERQGIPGRMIRCP